jgi:hypothetical protein
MAVRYPIAKELGCQLVAARKARGLSQRDLG